MGGECVSLRLRKIDRCFNKVVFVSFSVCDLPHKVKIPFKSHPDGRSNVFICFVMQVLLCIYVVPRCVQRGALC